MAAGRPEPRTTSRFDTRVDYMFSSEVNDFCVDEDDDMMSFINPFHRDSIRTGVWKTTATFHTMPQTTALLLLISVDSEKIYTCAKIIPFNLVCQEKIYMDISIIMLLYEVK